MLYIEHNFGRGAGWIRLFSTTDNVSELEKFRCLVRAPHQALHRRAGKDDRVYVCLFGAPKDRAVLMIKSELVFETPVDRMLWEKTQPEVMKRHPTPFTGIEANAGHRVDEAIG